MAKYSTKIKLLALLPIVEDQFVISDSSVMFISRLMHDICQQNDDSLCHGGVKHITGLRSLLECPVHAICRQCSPEKKKSMKTRIHSCLFPANVDD